MNKSQNTSYSSGLLGTSVSERTLRVWPRIYLHELCFKGCCTGLSLWLPHVAPCLTAKGSFSVSTSTSYKCACWHILNVLIQMGGIDDQFPALRSLLCNSMDFRSRLKPWRELEPWRKRKGMPFALNTYVPCVHLWHNVKHVWACLKVYWYSWWLKSCITGHVNIWQDLLFPVWSPQFQVWRGRCCRISVAHNFRLYIRWNYNLQKFKGCGDRSSLVKYRRFRPSTVLLAASHCFSSVFLNRKHFAASYLNAACKRMSAWPKDMILNDATPEISCHLSSMGWSSSYCATLNNSLTMTWQSFSASSRWYPGPWFVRFSILCCFWRLSGPKSIAKLRMCHDACTYTLIHLWYL